MNDRAPPYLPVVDWLVPLTVPWLPFPDESVTVVPDVSFIPYAATSPGENGDGDGEGEGLS
ncbi:hypothetical protein [Acrocarpospora macrocephala]|nr:hypothetical protein [Acrocarpospora macrocephala]